MTEVAPMTVTCPTCGTGFPVDPDRVPVAGVLAICSVCSRAFPVERPAGWVSSAPGVWSPDVSESPSDEDGEIEVDAEFEVEAGSEVAEGATVVEEVQVEEVFEDEESVQFEDSSDTDQDAAVDQDFAGEGPLEVEDDSGVGIAEEVTGDPGPGVAEEVADDPDREGADVVAGKPTREPVKADSEPETEVPTIVADTPPVAAGTAAAEEEATTGRARFGFRDPANRARRLARVLSSDMITYNPARYADARRNGSLREDFRDEIEKSWEEYVDQVGEEFATGTHHFTDALNEVLAQGEKLFQGPGFPY